jgi:hypothetical protein
LNNNNLTSLPRDLFEPLSRLRVLRLSENKWLCDCHLAWLGRFLRRHARAGSPLAANGYLPRCHAPFGLRIKAVSELLDTEFKCTGKSVNRKKKLFFFLFFLSLFSSFSVYYPSASAAAGPLPAPIYTYKYASWAGGWWWWWHLMICLLGFQFPGELGGCCSSTRLPALDSSLFGLFLGFLFTIAKASLPRIVYHRQP